LIDDTSSSIDEYGSTEDTYPAQTHLSLIKRHLDSAEKYFDWASKTNRKFINQNKNIHFLFLLLLRSYGIFTRQTFLGLQEKR
jgi:hypothetical protein